jgi:hypothetical protein
MLRRSELDPTTRVLILPRAEALGEDEVRRIIAFVEAGGTVIADVRPGRFTDRVKPRAAGALDALFGVESVRSAEAIKKAAMEIHLDEGQPAWRFKGMTVGSGIKASGAAALGRAGDAPVLFSHRVGRGRAILLNFSLATYPRVGAAESPAGTAELWRALLGQAGVVARMTLARVDGGPRDDIRVQRWQNGKIELVGIMRESERQPRQRELTLKKDDRPADFVLTLATPRQVYDLRDHRDLGQQGKVTLQLSVGRATFLALLPEAVPELHASLSQQTVHPGDTANLRVASPGAMGDDAIAITALKPDGTEADWLRSVRVVPRGEAVRIPIPLALNDAAGRWVVRVKELYANHLMEIPLVVGQEMKR